MNEQKMDNEMEKAEVSNEVTKQSGLTWAYGSLALIILTFILVIALFFLLPDKTLNKLNQNANAPGTNTQPK